MIDTDFEIRSRNKQKESTETLLSEYANICNKIVAKFCKKQEIEFDFWVLDEAGGIASFNTEYFFSMSDIILDLNTKQKKGLILNWQIDSVDSHLSTPFAKSINYNSFIMGARYAKHNGIKCAEMP